MVYFEAILRNTKQRIFWKQLMDKFCCSQEYATQTVGQDPKRPTIFVCRRFMVQ